MLVPSATSIKKSQAPSPSFLFSMRGRRPQRVAPGGGVRRVKVSVPMAGYDLVWLPSLLRSALAKVHRTSSRILTGIRGGYITGKQLQ